MCDVINKNVAKIMYLNELIAKNLFMQDITMVQDRGWNCIIALLRYSLSRCV